MAKLVTWDSSTMGSEVTLSNDNLTAAINKVTSGVKATLGRNKGKWYWEIYANKHTTSNGVGVIADSVSTDWVSNWGYGNTARLWAGVYLRPGNKEYSTNTTSGRTIGVALDLDNGIIEFYANGVGLGIAYTDISLLGDTIYPYVVLGNQYATVTYTANFGEQDFVYQDVFDTLAGLSYKSYDGSQGVSALLKQNNQYYSIKPEYYNSELRQYIPLDFIDFENGGFGTDLLFNEVTINEETFIPIDKFNKFSLVSDNAYANFNIRAIPTTKQLTVASDDIPSSIANNIDSFTLISNKSENADIRLALSIDKGNTWKTYNATTLLFEDLTDCVIPLKPYELLNADELIQWNSAMDNIATNGITPDVFNILDFNLLNADYIRFAYVLSRPTYSDIAETSQLDWQFDAKGTMRKMTDLEHYVDVYEHEIKVTNLIDNPLIKVNVMA